MKLKVLGTRGSFVSVRKENEIYGRNTSSFYLDAGTRLFLDAGTGILHCEDLPSEKAIHILLSHVHIDHVLGLFEWKPLYDPDREIRIYGHRRKGKTIMEQLDAIIGPPYWPIRLSQFPAKIRFHDLEEGKTLMIDDLAIDSIASIHPDETYMYRIENNGISFGYALDYETGRDEERKAERFFRNCDLVIFDGNDLPGQEKEGYGHSSWKQGMELCTEAKIRKLLISHYGYDLDDAVLKAEETAAGELSGTCVFAKEGMEISL